MPAVFGSLSIKNVAMLLLHASEASGVLAREAGVVYSPSDRGPNYLSIVFDGCRRRRAIAARRRTLSQRRNSVGPVPLRSGLPCPTPASARGVDSASCVL